MANNAVFSSWSPNKCTTDCNVGVVFIDSRAGSFAKQAVYEQAKRELTGGPDMDLLEAVLESIPESEGWDPVPGSTGRHMPGSLGEDEDSEGRSESAQLVEEGIKEAEHDQMLQAARAAQKRDRREL